ncbi:MAG TPA: DUF2279 domain-containing protein [Polyangiaceae bacterium]|nr:DUF2279 domain-containing protein [Polyangiaceae bacterium]
MSETVPPPPTAPAVPYVNPAEQGFPWKKAGSVAIVGGIYGTAWVWVSAAWWSRKSDSNGFVFHDEGAFAIDTYAGGTDKLGHYYAAYLMNRGFAGIFEWGGFPRKGSIITATVMTTTFLTAVEFKDAYHLKYGFSWGDIVSNSSGQLTALALMLVPPLDRAISVKIMYQPSGDFFHALSTDGPLNTPEDYSGQTYLLAYHFASLPVVNRERSLRALRYVDFSIGYGTLGYKPVPDPPIPVRQNLSFGFSVNFQAVFDDLLWPKRGTPSTGTQVVHFINEVYQVPYTRVPVLSLQRTGPATKEGRN